MSWEKILFLFSLSLSLPLNFNKSVHFSPFHRFCLAISIECVFNERPIHAVQWVRQIVNISRAWAEKHNTNSLLAKYKFHNVKYDCFCYFSCFLWWMCVYLFVSFFFLTFGFMCIFSTIYFMSTYFFRGSVFRDSKTQLCQSARRWLIIIVASKFSQ